jgi:glycosyltransferase involved in cell wall biosynthesis
MTDHGQGRGFARVPGDREWQWTDAVVAVSEAVARRRQIPAIERKTRVIRNGVQSQPSSRDPYEVREELGLAPDRFLGLIVARIDGLKGHETLLRAVARLKQSGDPGRRMTLLIAGDGAKRACCEALTEDLGLSDEWVRFLGFRTDAPDLLAASDLFLLPSLTEGLPLSVLEAMTHGLPVIATPVGGVPEVVLPGRTGVLVPVEDEEALAGAISTLMQDARLRRALGEAGRERARGEFSFARMVARYDALYREILSSPAAAR